VLPGVVRSRRSARAPESPAEENIPTPPERSGIRGVLPTLLGSGRLVAAACVGVYFAILAAIGGADRWGRLGVSIMGRAPGGSPTFADLRETTSAWSCIAHGRHVLPGNPCDPWHRPFDHPRIWLLPGYLGAHGAHTELLGILLACGFFVAALAVIPRDAGPLMGLLYGVILCSPAVMLGVERGNADLAVFALVVAGLLVVRRSRTGLTMGSGLVLFAAVLKLVPILALPALLRRSTRAAAIVAVAFGVFVVATLDDIRSIARAVPQTDGLSYGVRRLSDWTVRALGSHGVRGTAAARAVDLVLIGCAIGIALLLARRFGPVQAPHDDPERLRDSDLFVAGASIYAVSYALTHNKDYRLVFVLLTVPQLSRWARERRPLAVLTLLAMVGCAWLDPPWSAVPVVAAAIGRWNELTVRLSPTILPPVVPLQLLLFVGLLAPCVALVLERRRAPSV
jgi:hypothetical protein